MSTNHRLDPRTVRERAHRIWEARGREEGHALDDWLTAERELRGERTARSKSPDRGRTSPAATRRARAEPPAKVPNPPELEVDSVSREVPKLGSTDAPGG